ncbi:hypothetical protein [Spartinivicinus poritis]|uniref:Integrase n=1 Tax=Spartinivicinus poritis TaxID=2994640 RepID=A0ABT5UEF7_9GAMM|nr:hypothetical protein [Spartinivicinus sp. A2-2]MDE1464763.1 hypothetical protein [Spartinivicinus sp. A2-2]
MADGRSNRKAKVVPFIDQMERDRQANLNALIKKAKLMKPDGFEFIDWQSPLWRIVSGRLTKLTGKNAGPVSINFLYSQKLGSEPLQGEWDDLTKSLFVLRFHRKHQAVPNQRNFTTAVGYVAYAANQLGLRLSQLTPEVLDNACRLVTQHYSDGTAYNLHKHIAEFAAHCDANGLCRVLLQYKYSKMKRPENTGGLGHKRLDDPETTKNKSDKLVEPLVFKVVGELYQNIPQNHKYRFYVLILTLLACTGRRFSEISLLPDQILSSDLNGKRYLEYFPRKASRGDVFTPKRKLYLPSEVVSIVESVVNELKLITSAPRRTAVEMCRVKGPDLTFMEHIGKEHKLYKADLIGLGINPQVIHSHGWIRKNGFAWADEDAVTCQGIKPANPIYFTTKEGVEAYCKKNFFEACLQPIHIDQQGKEYYLKDLLLIRFQGLSSGAYSKWTATQCTHAMFRTFLRYFPDLADEYASSSIEVDFTSHHFRHTLNTLLDEGGLSDLLQTEWFGRTNPRDTKAYQHTSREKRALMLREDIKKGLVGGQLADQIKVLPVNVQDAILQARIQAVHDVGTGICIHNFSQIPCERHLQCSADCMDYVWAKDDKGRLNEQKRQYALTEISREAAEQRMSSNKPKKSSDWLLHNEKKLKTLKTQLADNGVVEFNAKEFLKEVDHG